MARLHKEVVKCFVEVMVEKPVVIGVDLDGDSPARTESRRFAAALYSLVGAGGANGSRDGSSEANSQARSSKTMVAASRTVKEMDGKDGP